MQKTPVIFEHSKIVFLKLNRASPEKSENVHWSRH